MANNIGRIWETDPDSKPRERSSQFQNDIVGRFRSGRLVGKTPEALNEWRVTTGDPVIAELIAGLMGGESAEWDTDKEDNLEILTDSKAVAIIIDSSDKLDASMKLFGNSGLVHHCDGVEFLSPDEDKGEACGCPPLLEDRKAKARSGRGPKPSVDLIFKLEASPESGYFRFNSGSWELVKVLHTVIESIDKYDGPVRATLAIENVSYTTKAGRDVSYNKPVISVVGAYVPATQADMEKAA
ncbi:recombination directionality factor [Streptomyces niveus]|uniref:recombination directionality factor n=1 Tax=Streptomyces niveus TaxID=193462 RepID=UPI0036567012